MTSVDGPVRQEPGTITFDVDYSDGSRIEIRLETGTEGWKVINVLPLTSDGVRPAPDDVQSSRADRADQRRGQPMMAPSGKTAPGKVSPAAAAPTSRPYATSGAELNRPYVPGETAAEQKQAAEGWRWILLAALGVAAIVGYTKVWPAAQQFLYRPSPARDYLLPPSPEPVYVIAGVGVGWFWILFIAAPVVGRGPGRAVVGDAVLVESPCAHRAHGARAARAAMDRRAVPHRAADPGRRARSCWRPPGRCCGGRRRQRRTCPAGCSSWRCSPWRCSGSGSSPGGPTPAGRSPAN